MDIKSIKNLEFDKIIEILSDKINTDLGKKLAENLKISSDFDEVAGLQAETDEAQKLIFEGNSIEVRDILELSPKLKLAEIGATIDTLSLLSIAKNLRTARLVYDKISHREDLPIIQSKVLELFRQKDFEQKIFESIISENEISDNASPDLKSIRKEIININERIKTKLSQLVTSGSFSKYLQDSIVTQRQDRYVIPVKAEYRANIPGIVHDTSSSGATIFVEPMSIVEFNNDLRLAYRKEKDEIEKILSELSAEAGSYSKEIKNNQGILAHIDFVMGKGKLSVDTKSISPKMNNNKIIRLKNAKHPLINKNSAVPLNIHIGDKFNTLVITGPNTGGKTVTLKTVGLFVLMTQAGLHIPCDFGSTLPVFENVFSDIGDDQSISQNLSTFSSHMINVVRILKKATNKTLFLLDELGSGTDPDEGAALAISILEFLKNKKATTISTTHYSDLKQYAINTEFVENASVEFDVETLSPTYKLLIGLPGKSNAFHISEKLGLDTQIIEEAKRQLHSDNIKMEDILLKIEQERQRIEKERELIDITSENIRNRLRNIEKKERQIENTKEKILRDAKKEAQSIVKNSKIETDKIISELRYMQQNFGKANNSDIEKYRKRISDLGGEFSTEETLLMMEDDNDVLDEDELFVGNTVFVFSFQKNATITSLDNRKKQAVVQMDNMKINVPFSALKKPIEEKSKSKKTGLGNIKKSKSSSIKPEVDIRGMDLETAGEHLSKYLDDAYLSNVGKVTVIHGMGTGVLKKGVESILKSTKYIKSYKTGSYGEGGQGVTIVEFK